MTFLPQIVTCGVVHRPVSPLVLLFPDLALSREAMEGSEVTECSKQFKHSHKLFAAFSTVTSR
jgi:hypothetical protein